MFQYVRDSNSYYVCEDNVVKFFIYEDETLAKKIVDALNAGQVVDVPGPAPAEPPVADTPPVDLAAPVADPQPTEAPTNETAA